MNKRKLNILMLTNRKIKDRQLLKSKKKSPKIPTNKTKGRENKNSKLLKGGYKSEGMVNSVTML